MSNAEAWLFVICGSVHDLVCLVRVIMVRIVNELYFCMLSLAVFFIYCWRC
jgi:hypothetical protein